MIIAIKNILIFYLFTAYEAEKAQVNILPRLRIYVGFTIDVMHEGSAIVIKYANENDKEIILYFTQMILA